jgi:hypothetical protein
MGELQNAKIWSQKSCNLADSQNSFSWETLRLIFERRRLIQGNAAVIYTERQITRHRCYSVTDVVCPVFRAERVSCGD